MKIYLASDHAGFELKEKVKEMLFKAGHEVEDFGATVLDLNDDYPDYIQRAAEAVAQAAGRADSSSSPVSATADDPYGAQPAQAYPATSYGVSSAPPATTGVAPETSSYPPPTAAAPARSREPAAPDATAAAAVARTKPTAAR